MTSDEEQKLILFIDDEPHVVARFALALERADLRTRTLSNITEVGAFLGQNDESPGCILLDLRFPGATELPLWVTKQGMRVGQALIPALQSHYQTTPIVIFSAEPIEVLYDIRRYHPTCHVLNKDEANGSIEQFVGFIRALAEDVGLHLIERLSACNPGPQGAAEFERLCIDALHFLFLPPQKMVLSQSAKKDRSEIRDAVIPNVAERGYWNVMRHEYGAKQILFEFKNLTGPIGKEAVQQLAGYLNKTIGRFGILISRTLPSTAAIKAQRKVLTDDSKLVLFVDDSELMQMLKSRRGGGDPTDVLYALKHRLELE